MLNRCSRGLLRDYEPSCVPSFLALVGSCRRSHIAGSHSGVQVQASKRRSQGGDSKYGFPNKGGGAGEEAGYSDKRATVHKQRKEASSVPVLPPKIDRQKKPSKKSAAERLFGRSSGNNNNNSSGNNNGAAETEEVERQHGDTAPAEPAEPEHAADTRAGTGGFHSLPAVSAAETSKKNTLESNSSRDYDSYTKHAAAAAQAQHESGYAAYSRSLSQPAQQSGYATTGPGSGKFGGGPQGDKYR